MEKLQALFSIICMSCLWWGGGFLAQKSLVNDFKIQTNTKWTVLFGIKPGSQPLFIRPAMIQLIALLSVIVGSIVIWKAEDAFVAKIDVLTLTVFILMVTGIVFGSVDIWNNIQGK